MDLARERSGQQVKRGGVTLCTDSFSSDEVGILREALKLNFNLESSIHKKKSKNGSHPLGLERIYIKKEGLDELIPDLVPPPIAGTNQCSIN